MAQVIMTDAQKELLKADPNFALEVKWAIQNKASYWLGLDGTAVPGGQTAANLARWAKSRAFAAQIIANPAIAQTTDTILNQFLMFVKTIAVWDSVANTSTAAITWMLANGTFDTLADNWLDNRIQSSPF